MKNEQEMLDLFQVEELEKRFEMGWVERGSISVSVNLDGITVIGKITF